MEEIINKAKINRAIKERNFVVFDYVGKDLKKTVGRMVDPIEIQGDYLFGVLVKDSLPRKFRLDSIFKLTIKNKLA